jgi:hypothetical protein
VESKRPARGQAKKQIVELSKIGKLRFTDHWRLRAQQRLFRTADALSAIDNGEIREEGEWDPEHRNWKWRIEGFDRYGAPFRVVVAYAEKRNELFLISGMRRTRGKWQSE